MVLWACTGNEQVVCVGVTEVEASEDLVDEPLKGLGGISETKWHSKEFK